MAQELRSEFICPYYSWIGRNNLCKESGGYLLSLGEKRNKFADDKSLCFVKGRFINYLDILERDN
jgi:hypothetical protein